MKNKTIAQELKGKYIDDVELLMVSEELAKKSVSNPKEGKTKFVFQDGSELELKWPDYAGHAFLL
jgi:hypothetical protein